MRKQQKKNELQIQTLSWPSLVNDKQIKCSDNVILSYTFNGEQILRQKKGRKKTNLKPFTERQRTRVQVQQAMTSSTFNIFRTRNPRETPSYQRWRRGPLTDASVFTQALRTRPPNICEGSKKVLTCWMKGSCHGWPRG